MNAPDFSMMDLFREEVRSHTASLSVVLPALAGGVTDPQRIEPLMRAAHSIKGAARIVGIEPAAQLAGALEEVLVGVQAGRVQLTAADVEAALRATEMLAGLGQVDDEALPGWTSTHETALAALAEQLLSVSRRQASAAVVPDVTVAATPALEVPAPQAVAAVEMSLDNVSMMDLFREEVRAHTESLSHGLVTLESTAGDLRRIEPLMRAAHSIKGAARIVGIDRAVELAHALEEVLVAAQHGRVRITPAEIDIALRATDVLASLGKLGAEDVARWTAEYTPAVRELTGLLAATLGQPQPPPSPAPAPPTPSVAPASTTPPVSKEEPAKEMAAPTEAVVRVTALSLNRLMSLAGESLVQARWLQPFATALLKLKKHQDHLAGMIDGLAQALTAEKSEHLARLVAEARRQSGRCGQALAERIAEFEEHASQAENLNTRLYREVIVSRMRPFADGAHAFPRLVRDMARRLGKQVQLDIVGQTTEVDRDILDKLEAPLTHLLRNALDHGIESPAARRTTGKPETGTLRIEARHRAGMLVINVADDGAGIDLGRLRHKVVERQLANASMVETMKEAELLEFLFLPGFSTAAAVTEFSGRGVGLDVVQDMVRKVGGSVHISTRPGSGTTFHLQLPITLSVLRAVVVTIGGEPYAFPHNRIDRLVRVARAQLGSIENRQFVSVDGSNVGLVLAAQMFDLAAAPPDGDELPVLLVSDASGQYGLIVESFRGEQDLVVRPLDPRLGKVPNISAAAILDDGAPVLIADVEDLIRSMDHYIQTGTLARCERAAVAPRQRKRVLVVDDSITVREVERQILRTHGYDVAVAVDGSEGWNVARSERFDLIISDVDMPRMNGLDLVRAVRSDPQLREVPVVIVSYKDREDDRMRGLEVGANYYLTKGSFHDNTFLQAVRDLIGEP
jgi:two-component system sensor histidine kinase and response regulator WspE